MRVIGVCSRIATTYPPINTKQAKEIVSPEPHSTGADFRKAWNYVPRWLQIILVWAVIVTRTLVVILIKG